MQDGFFSGPLGVRKNTGGSIPICKQENIENKVLLRRRLVRFSLFIGITQNGHFPLTKKDKRNNQIPS
jgi:hypothetical protein